jgi:hypothetical protein
MNHRSFSTWVETFLFPFRAFALALLVPCLATAQTQPVTVTVTGDGIGADPASHFLGLSYEMSMLLPQDGQYYFDPHDQALVNTFKTLGIKSLRVGADAVDDPRIPVPQEKDINALFDFARAAGVKVIYSFRLKNGDPAESARLAAYIAVHDEDALECFSIGNEPNFYPVKTYEFFFAHWKPDYDAILKAVPDAMFDGPSADGNFALHLAKDVFADGHLAMASDHYYFLGSGRAGEKDPPATRARFLSNRLDDDYEKEYARVGAVLAAEGVPYRIDEMNSCYNGGAKNSSDTYASTLWALDCTHWWAAHHILGMNYHTGEMMKWDGGFGGTNKSAFVNQPGVANVPILGLNVAPNYTLFVRQENGHGVIMRPQAYAFLAFSQGAHGQPLEVKIQAASEFNFKAYAYRDHDGSIYLTLINKSYGDHAQPAVVSLQLPPGVSSNVWQRMDLAQKNQDVAAKIGVMLGDAAIDPHGIWSGRWKTIKGKTSGELTVQVDPASAAILHLSP